MQEAHTYPHFCPLARALERLGERWGLLIVRDLLAGEMRFTDLLHSCGGITPRQLSVRLRQLEQAGIVERRRTPGRREVWYKLTPAGEDLRGAVESLLLWGVKHASRQPADDEPVRAFHVLNGTRLALESSAWRPTEPVRWTWHFPAEPYTLRFDGTRWSLAAGTDPEAAVVIDTTTREWARLVMAARGVGRTADALRFHGAPAKVDEFRAAFGIVSSGR